MKPARSGEIRLGLDGARVHFTRWGERGPRVLLVHAIGFDHRSWEPLVPHLRERCELVALDLPGHGRSDKPREADYHLPALGRRVVSFLDELGWDDAILVGNSIGGGTALAATLQAPERVRGLALLNSIGFRAGLPLLGRLALLPWVPWVAGAYLPPAAVRLGLELVRHGWGSVSAERCVSSGEYFRDPAGRAAFFSTLQRLYGPELDAQSARYGEIRCPVQILHGQSDPLIRPHHARRLAEAIPRAELVPLARCGHFPQEECPDRVAAALHAFLDRLDHEAETDTCRHEPRGERKGQGR